MLPHGQLSDAMAASMRVQAMSTLAGTNPKQVPYEGRWSAVLFELAAVQSEVWPLSPSGGRPRGGCASVSELRYVFVGEGVYVLFHEARGVALLAFRDKHEVLRKGGSCSLFADGADSSGRPAAVHRQLND